jgi:uncharacterized coiled-coil DUF342 family protein
MNKNRRQNIANLVNELEGLRGQLDDIRSQLETIRDEEQDYFDNMPESFQSGDKGQAAESAVSYLDEAIGSIESIELDDAIGSLESAGE